MNTESYTVVQNSYVQDKDLSLTFSHNGHFCKVGMGAYKLIVFAENEQKVCEIGVDAYYDCLRYCCGFLYVGNRFGLISKVDIDKGRIIKEFFINESAAKYYDDHINIYPYTLPHIIKTHELGDYTYLPELHIMNEVVSHNAITVLAENDCYIAAGDVSGRVSVWDVGNMSLKKSFEVEGAISNLEFIDDSLQIDYVADKEIESPSVLTRYEKAMRKLLKY